LPQTILERIARRRQWLSHYPVKRRVAFHPHTPRLVAMRLARELFLMDLVQLSLFPSVPAELRRLAEELILGRLPQLPLGQKLTLRDLSELCEASTLTENLRQYLRHEITRRPERRSARNTTEGSHLG